MRYPVMIKKFLKQFIHAKSVRFSAKDEEPNACLQSVMKQADDNWKKGNHSPVFNTGEDAVIWIEKQDI